MSKTTTWYTVQKKLNNCGKKNKERFALIITLFLHSNCRDRLVKTMIEKMGWVLRGDLFLKFLNRYKDIWKTNEAGV
jgi:endonuclease III